MASYFAGDKAADTNGDGVLSVQDLFTFVQEWIPAYIKAEKKTETTPASTNTKSEIGGPASDSSTR